MTENRWMENDSWLRARRLNAMINSLTHFTRRTTLEWLPEISSQTGLKGEHMFALFELSVEPDQSLKQLSENIMAATSNVSVMIQSMVEEGIVSRVTDPADRRRVLLRLSEEGEKLFSSAQDHLIKRYQEYLEGLNETDQKDLDQAAWAMLMVMEKIQNRSLLNRQGKEASFARKKGSS